MTELFSSEHFMPHGHCYLWQPGVLWLQVVTNAVIALSYVAIAATLAWMVWRGPVLPFRALAVAFGTFIISCGLTHIFDVYVIWKPDYWTDGFVRAITAVASAGTALMLPPLVPRALALARGAHAARERGVQLETMVRELEQLNERTRELDRLKTQFFANVSHELRTPLTLVLGPIEKLLARGGLGEPQRRDLEVARRNARTLLRQVDELLDVSKLEAGKMGLDYARARLDALVRRVAAHFEALASERGIAFVVETPRELPADVDVPKVERVVLNLLSNAFKFTPPGGRVRCTLRREGDEAVIEVADSGPGIPPAMRARVFERFEQAVGGDAQRFGGSGLGLAICSDFLTLHRGTVTAAGLEVAETFAPVEPVAGRLEGREDGALVLVVEDNPDMRRFVAEAIANDHRVATAADGRQGLETARAVRPDLVVTDMMMPGLSGEELIQHLRRDPDLAETPVIVLTAKADDELRVRLLREGARDYVMKPFFGEELRARVANQVALKRARDVLQRELESRRGDVEGLAAALAARKRELETALASTRVAREQAEHASRAKSDFLRLVSHELRTPLATIALQVELLRLDPAAPADVVRRLATSAQRLGELVDELLQYARIERGGLTVDPEAFDLRGLVAGALDEVRPHADPKGLALALDAPPDLPPLHSDPRLVHLVVINLLTNAVKFTERGEVRVTLRHEGGLYRLAVADTGRGIGPELRARIFEPFVQGEPTRQKHLQGVGLGLALVKEVTVRLGGRVEVESSEGRGSTFRVTLPPLAGEPGG